MHHPTFQKTSQKKTLRGFSFGEVLLAAFVLTAGLLSVMALMASSLRHSLETRDAIIATGLAQEGIELVRNVRDNDWARGGTGFPNATFRVTPTKFPYCRISFRAVNASCRPMYAQFSPTNYKNFYYYQYSPSSTLRTHGGSGSDRFSRFIYLDYQPASSMALVRSFAYWGSFYPNSNGSSTGCTVANKCVFTEATLTGWK